MMLPVGITLVAHGQLHQRRVVGRRLRPDHPWCIVSRPVATASVYRHPAQSVRSDSRHLTLPVLLIVYRLKPKDGMVAWTWFTLLRHHAQLAEIWRQADFTLDRDHRRPALRAADDRDRHLSCIVLLQPRGPRPSHRYGPRSGAVVSVRRDARSASRRALSRADVDDERARLRDAPPAASRSSASAKAAGRARRARAIWRRALTDIGENYVQEAQQKFAPPAAGAQALHRARADQQGQGHRRAVRRGAERGSHRGRRGALAGRLRPESACRADAAQCLARRTFRLSAGRGRAARRSASRADPACASRASWRSGRLDRRPATRFRARLSSQP